MSTNWINILVKGSSVATKSTNFRGLVVFDAWTVSRVSEKSIWINAHGQERRFRKSDGKGISMKWMLVPMTLEVANSIRRMDAMEKVKTLIDKGSHRTLSVEDLEHMIKLMEAGK